MATPVVGAVNGATFTGGLEIALGCDFLIASERAVFADTHARVGVLPGGGLTARLPSPQLEEGLAAPRPSSPRIVVVSSPTSKYRGPRGSGAAGQRE